MKHQKNHIIARVFYAKVVEDVWPAMSSMNCMDLLDKRRFTVTGEKLMESFTSADLFDSEKAVTRTELARRLTSAGPMPFTVCFQKAYGDERVLRGRLLEHEDLLGRSLVHDFDIEEGTPLREVDHRTLLWLVLSGVKYTLKRK